MLQPVEAFFFDLHRCVVGHVGGRCSGARTEDEAEAHIEFHIVNELHGALEVLIGFPGEADDEVGTDGDIGTRCLEPADLGLVLQGRVGALHHGQDAIRTALHRQVQEAHQLGRVLVDLYDVIGKFDGVAGGVANAVYAIDGGHQTQQLGEAADLPVMGGTAIGVDVLPQ